MKIRVHSDNLIKSLKTESEVPATKAAIITYLESALDKKVSDVQARDLYDDKDKEIGWHRVFMVYASFGNDKTMTPVAYCSEPVAE